MKRKTNKKSGIIAAVVGLSAVSLVSIGFASWVMSGNDNATLDGTISVETLDDQRFLIYKTDDVNDAHRILIDYGTTKKAGTPAQAASSICFGIDDSTPINDAWLTASSTVANNKYENLTATVSFYVANLQNTEAQEDVPSAVLEVNDHTTDEIYNWALASGNTKNYVKAPSDLSCAISASETFNHTDGLTYRKVTVAVEFEWGSYFTCDHDNDQSTPEVPVNPYVFFNKKPNTTANGNTAHTVLTELEKCLDGVSFTIRLATDSTKA